VTGRVSALEDGSPLPGVNVVLKGTTTGTVTDADGKYSLNVPSNGGSIVFSFIGLQTQEIAIGDRTVVDVGLSLDVQQLSEVVVTGVGVATERKKIAIDVASVSGKDLVPTAIASIDQALQGKVAGAQVLLSSGEPGATANIQLRGINSLGNANPIILLDGVQVGTGNATSALAGLDMSNIERVEVVKGAAAGMLYGAQGANGVIQIFTKKGSRDKKVNVTLNTRYIVDQVVEGKEDLKASMHHYDTDASGFIVSSAGGRITPDPVTGTWSEPLVNLAPDTKNDNPYLEQTYDQLDQVYRQAATVNTSLNISGGSDKYDYSVNVARLDQENVRFGDLKRYNIGLNVGTEIVKNFTLRSTTQYVVENENLQSGNRFALVNSYPWVDFNARYANGYLVIKPKAENEFNPLSELEWRTRGSKNNRILQNFNLNYKFPKFFELDYKYGLQLWSTNYDDIIRSQKGFLQPADAYWGPGPGTGQVILTNDKSTYQNSLLTALARFDFKNDFNINVPLVATTQLTYDWRKDEYSRIRGQATNFPYPPYNLNNGGSKNTSSYSEEFITYGYLVNQTFEYGDIAGLSVGFRADYSSEFGFDAGGVKPFTFPRGTFFFNPSELFTSELIGNWKLRAAYGEAGVQPGRYARQVVLGSATYGDSQGLFNPSTAKNPSLKVQRNKELEIGTDLTLTPSISDSWLSKVVFGFTYWDRKGEDIIQPANLPPSSGAGTIIDNLISLSSNGIEFNLDIDAYKSDNFKWNLGLRYATAETIVDKISQGLEVPYGENGTFLIREGAPLGIFIGQVPVRRLDEKRPDGTFYIDEADRDDFQVVSTQYGDIVVEKATKIAMLTGSDDKRVMGNPQPDFFGSIINDFTIFKNLQVNMQWDFSYGNEIYNQTRQWLYRDRLSKDFDLPVSIDGESGAFVTMYNSIYNSVQPTGWFVEDGSFMRLRSLSFTYNLAGAIKAKWAKQLSITAAGRNLVTFTKYRGIDPESTSTGNTTDDGLSTGNSTGPARGIDSFNFPNLKSYQVGLTIGF
jgi:TonB-linked SusC/RagA family outer membrane protein